MPKFDMEEHQKRMRELLTPKPQEGNRPLALQKLLDTAKLKIKRTSEGEEGV